MQVLHERQREWECASEDEHEAPRRRFMAALARF